jgi:glycosyltransferase involved in cell wall biosynthesis
MTGDVSPAPTPTAAPDVSVIVPCRDAAAWIAETLSSVLEQRGTTCELIVVDDGSRDNSADLAEATGARVFRCPPLGVSAARNAGTARATGRYLQYLDADDVLEPGTLARRVEIAERTGADVVLVAWRQWKRERSGEFAAGEVIRRRLGDRADVSLLTNAWWPPGAVCYRRAMVDRVGVWREDLPVIQDARFLLDAALAGASFDYLDDVGLKYRIHGPSSLSRRDPRAFVEDCYRSAAELHDRWLMDGTLDTPRRDALVLVLGYVARAMFPLDRGRFDEVLERLHTLDPKYRPDAPALLRKLSGAIGYRSAEHVALWWRQLKGLTRPQ